MDVRWKSFIWDDQKARRVFNSRGISFKEAAQATGDPHAVRGADDEHSEREPRQWLIGRSPKKRLLLVIYMQWEGDLTRIITTWKANEEDRKLYDEENSG